jgi:uncharacterized protein YheU (UPF0270 family)
MTEFIEIPYRQLSEEALQGVIEEFINREGTDYGAVEYSLDSKVEQLKARLQAGKASIVFDTETQSCSFLNKEL